MRIASIDTREVTWRLDGRGAARGLVERRALLLEVRASSGAIGLGEAAPLPGTSPDTIEDAARAFAGEAAALLAATIDASFEEVAAIAARVASAPAARFALETAMGAALAEERGVSLAALLGETARSAVLAEERGVSLGETARSAVLAEERGVSLAALLGGDGQPPVAHVVDDPEGARRAVALGARTLKLKVGPRDREIERVREISAAVPGARLRLDANRSWPRASVRARMEALAGLPIDFIEEPCRDAHQLLTDPFILDGPHAFAIALDESLAGLDVAALARVDRLAAVVVKPTLLGLAGSLRVAAAARARGIAVIVSHALEGPVGTAACAELARALAAPGVAAGLGPHAGLDAWSLRVPQLADPTRLAASPRGGLGLGPITLAELVGSIEVAPPSTDALAGPARLAASPARGLGLLEVAPPSIDALAEPTQVAAAPARALGLLEVAPPSIDALAEPAATPGRGPIAAPVAPSTDALSIEVAAREAGDRPAIVTSTASIDYAEAARRAHKLSSATRASGGAPRARVVVAVPSLETLSAVHAALEGGWPIALLHAKLPPEELQRQRELLDRTQLPEGTAVVLFTSGSSGPARAVAIGRAAVCAAVDANAAHLGWRPDDRWLCALSLAHAGGLAIAVRCLAARAPLVLIERDGDRDAPTTTVARALDEQRCTIASLVPSQLAALLDDPSWRPPGHLRAVLLGGAAAPPPLLAAAAARRVPFLVTYGMTEALGQIATADPARAGDPAALPRALPGVEIEGGSAEAPARLRVRAPMLATCYLGAAREAIAPELATGDLGHVEPDGTVHVAGRADDVIVSGGAKVHPSTIEAVVAAGPGIRAACVFGIADARWGHVVGLAIAADAAFDAPTAFARWHASLPPHARPRELAIADALPLLATGKPDRRAAAALPRILVRYR